MIEWDLRGCLPVGEDEYILPERENVAQSFGEQKTRKIVVVTNATHQSF